MLKPLNSGNMMFRLKCLNEQYIYKAYEKAFLKFNEKCLEVAKYPCMSCDKLCFKRECAEMNRLKVIPKKQNFLDFIESRTEFDDSLPNGYICDYCLEYFRSNRLSPRCILNGLDVGTIPDKMKMLNPYEKVLLQRAKCFQLLPEWVRLPRNICHLLIKFRKFAVLRFTFLYLYKKR